MEKGGPTVQKIFVLEGPFLCYLFDDVAQLGVVNQRDIFFEESYDELLLV